MTSRGLSGVRNKRKAETGLVLLVKEAVVF